MLGAPCTVLSCLHGTHTPIQTNTDTLDGGIFTLGPYPGREANQGDSYANEGEVETAVRVVHTLRCAWIAHGHMTHT